MNRQQAWDLLIEFTKSDSLIKHALAVEAAMKEYAPEFDGDSELWGIVGLLHDFDYERWPDPPDHTRKGAEILKERGVDEEIIGAILSHAEWNQAEYPLDRPLRKVLYAVDELCGFLMAVAYVRPERLRNLQASSVKKKLKQKGFAAGVNRDHIFKGVELLGIPLEVHVERVAKAMQMIEDILGLKPEKD